MTMAPGDMSTAALPGFAAGVAHHGVQVTPLTAMAQAMAHRLDGGMTDANITTANAALGHYFSVVDIVHVRPMNPLAAGASAGDDARNYGMTLAAMSRYALSLNMATSSSMVTAMTDFMNSAANASGATAAHMETLIHKLTHSDGHF